MHKIGAKAISANRPVDRLSWVIAFSQVSFGPLLSCQTISLFSKALLKSQNQKKKKIDQSNRIDSIEYFI